jgi:hypothetical protein
MIPLIHLYLLSKPPRALLSFLINSLSFYFKTYDFFETLAPLSLYLAQKKHINVILDAQVVFTRDDEL